MTKSNLPVAFFASDIYDPAVHRRLTALRRAGCAVTLLGFEKKRYESKSIGTSQTIHLGTIPDRRYLYRSFQMLKALVLVFVNRNALQTCERFYARNLDMALLAIGCRYMIRKRAPLVYEVLDIARILYAWGPFSSIVRVLERFVLNRCDHIVVSSEAYIQDYFKEYQRYSGHWCLLENKLAAAQFEVNDRPTTADRKWANQPSQWSIGWFGTLKSFHSLRVLVDAANELDGMLRVTLRGITNRLGEGMVLKSVQASPYVSYEGPYDFSKDLPRMYERIDFAWCGDITDENLNVRLLLPNRLYEAGFFGVPLIAITGTYTSVYIERHSLGWNLDKPSVSDLVRFLKELDLADYNARVESILDESWDRFAGDQQLIHMVRSWRSSSPLAVVPE